MLVTLIFSVVVVVVVELASHRRDPARLQLNGDLTAFKRHYTPLVRRCDDMEKKIKFFTQEMAEYGISPERYTSAELKTWTDNQRESLTREHVGTSLLDYWETIIGERHRDYQAIKSERERTAALLYQAVQRRHVIEKAADFFLFESRNNAAWTEAAAPTSASGAAARDLEASTAAAGRRAGEEDDMSFRHIAGACTGGGRLS